MKKLALLAALLLFPVVSAPAADDGIHTKTLENGLRIVVKEDHSKPLAALRIYVGTGGALEMEYLGCGISHYYEHLLSGGSTSTRPETDSGRILMELGGQSNAYTSSDHTCYHIVTHRDFIAKAIDLYGDWMMNNVLDQNEVEREKKVILKEFNMGEDEPNRAIYKLFMRTMYLKHPIRVPNIGFRQNFLRITREDLVDYYTNRYSPDNTVVAVAGDVNPTEVFDLVEKAMGAWERRPLPVVALPEEPRQTGSRYAEAELDVKQASVRMGYHTINLFHPDLYALDMVAAVLSEGRSSRLFRRVVEKDRLTNAIDAYSYTPHFMKGMFGVVFQAPVENVEPVVKAVGEEIERIKTDLVTDADLERAKVQVVSGYQLRVQSVEDQAAQVGRDYMTTGDPRFSTRYVERIQAVTPAEVREAARKYLLPDSLTTVVLKPIAKAADETAGATESAGKQEVTKVVLGNGLRVLLKRVPGMSPIAIESYSLAGIRAEPEGKNGVSSLTARLLLKGTKTRSASDIARSVEEIGADIGSQGGNNTIGLSLTLARGERDVAFGARLMADILEHATFPQEEFDKEKENAINIASRTDENWQAESYHFMRRELFGDHPYGNPTVGTPDTLEGLTREDVVRFAKDRLCPDGTVIGVAGDFDPAKVEEALRTAFASWPRCAAYQPPAPPKPDWAGKSLPGDRFVFKENQKRQGVFAIAFSSPLYADLEDRAALLILDAFTSGIGLPSGWFHNALRGGERSYVYFVHLSIFPGLEGGTTYITTQTTMEYMKPVFEILMGEIAKLRSGDFTDQELEIGRAMALVSGPYYKQTVGDIASGMALSELYGIGYDWDERFDAALKKVTREDVMRVVDRYFGKMLVAVTGPAEARKVFEEIKTKGVR